MSMDRWYTIKELEALTGRKANSIRHHLVEEWALEGLAKKVNGAWLCNQDALFDIRARREDRDNAENRRLMEQERKAKAAEAVPPAPTQKPIDEPTKPTKEKISGFVFHATSADADRINKLFLEGFAQGLKPKVDELGRQTIYVDPSAKSVRVVLPAGCTASLLFDIEKSANQPTEEGRDDANKFNA